MFPWPGRYGAFLRDYLLPQWRLVSLLGFLLLGLLGLQLASPLIQRSFIDRALAGAPLHALTAIALLFLGVALLTQVISVAEAYVAENVGWLATNALRTDLTLHCLRLDPSFHNTHTPGELIERIDGDASTLANFFSRFVVYVLGNALLVLGVLGVLFRVDWRVGLAVTGTTAITLLVTWRLRHIAVPYWTAGRQASAELFGFLEERLSGTEDIRSSGAVAYVMRLLYERSRRLLQTGRRANVMAASLAGVLFFMYAVSMAIAVGVGAALYLDGKITIGTVYLIFAYTQMLDRPLDQIVRQLQDVQTAAAGVARAQQILATRSAIEDGRGDTLPRGPLAVSFDRVTFGYGEDDPVLHELSFEVRPGAVLGLLGRTGSGKTTVARLLFRLYDPRAGSARLSGVDLRDTHLATLRSRVGLVTQDIQLFHATVRDNLTFFDRTIPDERIEAVLRDLGLGGWLAGLRAGFDTMLSSGSSRLSAGEAQLLAFARVFLRDPGLVILDEASSRLDPATEQQIERAVDRLLAGRTGIVIAHRLGTIRRADDVVILEGGRVLEAGPRERLAREAGSHFSRLLRAGQEATA